MSVFFKGRLLISPTTASTVDDSAMYNQNLSVGNNVALIGSSSGGTPNTAMRFGSPQEAVAGLGSGELLAAVLAAFSPSTETNGPSQVIAIRVNPAVQSTLSLADASAGVALTLTSADYGLAQNQVMVKIEAGSTSGLRPTVQLGQSYFTQDNVARKAFTLQYAGAQATATMTITGTSLVLAAPTGTTVATLDLNVYKTIQSVVDRINQVAGFSASVQDGNYSKAALNGLDYVTSVDVKTALYAVRADLQAVVDWFNGAQQNYVTATRGTTGKAPAVSAFAYMAGGSDGVTTNTHWSNAFATLQTVDAQWICPVSSDSAIHAMADAHAQFMSTIGRMERRCIVGTALSTTDVSAIAAAKALNSDRTSLVHIGNYNYDANGVLTLYPAYITAAMIAGAFAGVSPGTPMTNKAIRVQGLERVLRNPTDTDVLINGGVLCVENTTQGYKVVKSISTWLINNNYNRVEQSCGVALDFTIRNVRQALDVLRGGKNNPQALSRSESITGSTLAALSVAEPAGPGVLAGNKQSPAYRNITSSIAGDVLAVSFECSPVIPTNYVTVTVYAVPFSGSITSATGG